MKSQDTSIPHCRAVAIHKSFTNWKKKKSHNEANLLLIKKQVSFSLLERSTKNIFPGVSKVEESSKIIGRDVID